MGSLLPSKPSIPAGIYCPTITFFQPNPTQDIDFDAQSAHARFLMKAGVHGITIHGTTGESVLLSKEERIAVIKAIAAVKKDLKSPTTLVVGCSAESVRETVKMCKDAKENGGEYALVLPPSYWVKASTNEMLEAFFTKVADQSPIPIILYSFPSVTQGIDMDSDLIGTLATHSNIVGVKLTCGNAGKLTRLTQAFSPSTFSVFGGSTDWLLPGLIGKSCGAVTGLANTHPRSVVKLFNMYHEGKLEEAQDLQGLVSAAEWGMGKTGMAGTKYAVEWARGFETKVLPREPLLESDEGTKKWIRETMGGLMEYEKMLEKVGS